jgi:DNA-directed RNA polymerase specialized sigma24 family protein
VVGPFEQAWTKARGHVAAYSRRVTDHPAEADDLLQRVAIRAWRGHHTFRGDSDYLTWIMAIATREYARLGTERAKLRKCETPLGMEIENTSAADDDPLWHDPARHAQRAPTSAWLREAVTEAYHAGMLNHLERETVALRLTAPDITWSRIAEQIGAGREACATAHCRAVPKLRVFLFLHHQERLGGTALLRAAFERAAGSRTDRLTGSEADAFRALVLERRTDYRRRGWQGALRSACGKVARQLPALFEEAPPEPVKPRLDQGSITANAHPKPAPGGAGTWRPRSEP